MRGTIRFFFKFINILSSENYILNYNFFKFNFVICKYEFLNKIQVYNDDFFK